jgi:hypothetical protein
MSLKADSLKTNPGKNKAVAKEVGNILCRIDEEIKTAYDQDCKKATVTLPITFAVPYMSNKDAQRIIYYKVLESLIDRGFLVEIHLASDQTTFFIRWLTEEEEKEIDVQNTVLAKHSLKNMKK